MRYKGAKEHKKQSSDSDIEHFKSQMGKWRAESRSRSPPRVVAQRRAPIARWDPSSASSGSDSSSSDADSSTPQAVEKTLRVKNQWIVV